MSACGHNRQLLERYQLSTDNRILSDDKLDCLSTTQLTQYVNTLRPVSILLWQKRAKSTVR